MEELVTSLTATRNVLLERQSAMTADSNSKLAFKGTGEIVRNIGAEELMVRIELIISKRFSWFSSTLVFLNKYLSYKFRIFISPGLGKTTSPVSLSKKQGATPIVKIIAEESFRLALVLSLSIPIVWQSSKNLD